MLGANGKDDVLAEGNVSRLRAAPQQERSQARMEAVLRAADEFVAAHGPERASIPEIAELAGVPRASVYQFYPDKYALLSHVAERHLASIVDLLFSAGSSLLTRDYRQVVSMLVETAADYFDTHPAAATLLLGGPFSRAAYLAREEQISRLGTALRFLGANLARPLIMPEAPDVAVIAAEIGLACMRLGYYREGRVSRPMREQAVIASCAYLKLWEESSMRWFSDHM